MNLSTILYSSTSSNIFIKCLFLLDQAVGSKTILLSLLLKTNGGIRQQISLAFFQAQRPYCLKLNSFLSDPKNCLKNGQDLLPRIVND